MKFIFVSAFLMVGIASSAYAGHKTVWRVSVFELPNTPTAQLDYTAAILNSGRIVDLSSSMLRFKSAVVSSGVGGGFQGHLSVNLGGVNSGACASEGRGSLNLAVTDSSGLNENSASFKSAFSFSQVLKTGESQSFTFTQGDSSRPGQSTRYRTDVTFVSLNACDDLTDCLK